jgi:hypothetical protein
MDAAPVAEPLALYTDVEPRLSELRADGFGPGDPRFEDLVARYDAEILATDAAIGALVDGLAARGRLDRTVIVITADHGEEFLEHGWVEHGWTLERESIHVPLLFFAPGLLTPVRVETPISQIDVLPSLAELLDLPTPNGLDGASLWEADGDRLRPHAAARPVIAELLVPERNVVRTILWDVLQYFAAQQWIPVEARQQHVRRQAEGAGLPEVDPWGPVVFETVLRTDEPGAVASPAADPERTASLRARLADAVGGPRERTSSAPAVSSEEAERLRALGYH